VVVSLDHYTEASVSIKCREVQWKVMSKAVPLHAMEAPVGDWKYSSYSFLTSALDVQIYS